jgi:hypothetical protein
MSKGTLTVLLAFLIVLVASGMLVSAADAAVPGDWMYGVDRTMDGLRLSLALDSRQKAQVERQLALERLREAQTLARRGETENVERLRQESRQAMLAAKAADPYYVRKIEKSAGTTTTPAQITPREQRLGQNGQTKGDPYCNRTPTKRHPAVEKLAQHLGVSYSDVMGWYCQGYKLGEIGLAYRASRAKGIGVDEVFAQRFSGLGWEEIIQKYGLHEKEE